MLRSTSSNSRTGWSDAMESSRVGAKSVICERSKGAAAQCAMIDLRVGVAFQREEGFNSRARSIKICAE
jgi:hypothetical protein